MAKFCTNCGAPLEDAAKFCPGCGTQQVQVQQSYAPPSPQSYAPPPSLPKKKSKAPFIIAGAAALLVLIVVIALAGREDNSPAPTPPGYNSGGIPTAGGNPGQATQTQQPGGNIDPALLGTWYDQYSNSSYFDDTGEYTGVIGLFIGFDGTFGFYTFNADGSFFHVSGVKTGPSTGFQNKETGKFRIDGNTIYLYNRVRTESIVNKTLTNPNDSINDGTLEFQFFTGINGVYLEIRSNANDDWARYHK